MPLKDPEKRKEASKERMKKHRVDKTLRGVTSGVTKEGVTGKGVTRIEFIKSRLNPWTVDAIEQTLNAFEGIPYDRELRYERAYIYKLKREGKVPHVCIVDMGVEELRELEATTT